MVSEILRLEMMPLGVKVLTVNSGLIKTNLTSNSPAFKLPPDSLYHSIDRNIAARAKMEDVAQYGTEAEIYAESIVGNVLASKEGIIWRGAFASMLRYCYMILPGFLMVSTFFLQVPTSSFLGEGCLIKGAGYDDDKRKRVEGCLGLGGFRINVFQYIVFCVSFLGLSFARGEVSRMNEYRDLLIRKGISLP